MKSPSPDYYAGGRKRIFIGMLCATCLIICLLLLALLILPWFLHDAAYLRLLSLGAGVFGILILAWLCLILVFHIYTGRYFPGINWIRHVLIRLLLPLMEIIGKPFGIDKNLVRRSFIKINNELALANFNPPRPDRLLLLLPHCIQASACPRRLQFSIDNCASCGACQIGFLRRLAKERGFRIAIATGGTVARRIVVECRPECIVAVACERDLSSGIQDSYPIPVYGVLNERPRGPCRDTIVSEEQLLGALRRLLPAASEKAEK